MNRQTQPHPIWQRMTDEGRRFTWLAKSTGYAPEHLSRVFHKKLPATETLRAACALALGLPESELFHTEPDGDAPEEPTRAA